MSTTPILGITELAAAQSQPHVLVNAMARALEQGAGLFSVADKDLTAPPGSPADGVAYIVAASPTGAWSGQAKNIAYYSGTGWLFIVPREGDIARARDENLFYTYNGSSWEELAVSGTQAITLQVACSDLTTALATGTTKAYLRAPRAFTLVSVRSSLATVSSSGLVTVDINVNGSTILSTKLSIDASEKTSVTAATPAVISGTAIADDDEIAIDIDAAGTGAKGLIVTLQGT